MNLKDAKESMKLKEAQREDRPGRGNKTKM